MTLPKHCNVQIIDDELQLTALGIPEGSSNKFVIVLSTMDGNHVTLTANVAAMVHGMIRGAWERLYGEKLPT